MTETFDFPAGFVWGAATSSYQIEGAWDEDGKGESIWDRFSHTPGRVRDGDTGDVACDHYHRWAEDVALMQALGLQAYRFSVSWPRILPAGRGAVNPAGLDFYDRLVDGLLDAGIEPFVTLYHWDLPQALQDEGGWPARSTAEAFVEYADVLSRRLGDRVTHWITHNEPAVTAYTAHFHGAHAPGVRDMATALRVAHHLLLSHGWTVELLRRNSPGAEVGITLNVNYSVPASPGAADANLARRHDGMWYRWFLDPLVGHGYPADVVADRVAEGALPPEGLDVVHPGDMAAIAVPIDFMGVNYYRREVFRDRAAAGNLPQVVFEPPQSAPAWTEMGWEIYPEGLYHVLRRLHQEYQMPKLYVTENGCSFSGGAGADGRTNDRRRIDYLAGHFAAAAQAIAHGAPLAGYFVWSLFDNFEWAHGYAQRFGIVWVDFETGERIPKESALWYQRFIFAQSEKEIEK
ncbi:MAG: beta-glucosidase [Anaerolineae bacterium]|nr:beta-glucosidase [Anaerolineae bacterium]